MPCRDYFDEDISKTEVRIKHLKSDISKIREKRDSMARLLCEACEIIEKKGLIDKMSSELKHWKWAHDKADRKNK